MVSFVLLVSCSPKNFVIKRHCQGKGWKMFVIFVENNNRSKVRRQFLPRSRNTRPATLIPTSFSFISSIWQNVNVTLLLLCWCRERMLLHACIIHIMHWRPQKRGGSVLAGELGGGAAEGVKLFGKSVATFEPPASPLLFHWIAEKLFEFRRCAK